VLSFNLFKSFSAWQLRLAADIPDRFTALFGPSGAGKTTTLHLLAGLLQPDRGEIRLQQRVLFSSAQKINLPARQRRLGLVFQESRLFPHLSVAGNLRFGLPPSSRALSFEEIVELLQLQPLLARRATTCSGGEQQRIALGRALLAAPEYLLMDEPLVAVDLPERWRILAALRKIQRQQSLPVLYVSHDPSMVLNFAEHMLVVRGGELVERGDPFALFQKFVRAGESRALENLLKGKVVIMGKGFAEIETAGLMVQTPELSAAPGETVYLQIPAAEILLATAEPQGLSARNVWPGRIKRWRTAEHHVLVEVQINAAINLVVEILPLTVDKLALEEGKKIYVIAKASGIRKI